MLCVQLSVVIFTMCVHSLCIYLILFSFLEGGCLCFRSLQHSRLRSNECKSEHTMEMCVHRSISGSKVSYAGLGARGIRREVNNVWELDH